MDCCSAHGVHMNCTTQRQRSARHTRLVPQVGGRFSVCSAVGMLPLTLQYGWDTMSQFLEGANAMDDHFKTAPLEDNLPVLLGLISLWNISFLGYPARALLPYCQVRWLPQGYALKDSVCIDRSSNETASGTDSARPQQTPSPRRRCPSSRRTFSRCPWSPTARASTWRGAPCPLR